MIKTLRITSITAVALAVVFLVSSVVFGVRGDSEIEKFLESPGVLDMFKQAGGKNRAGTDSQKNPLIAAAEAFSKYLDPPIIPTERPTPAPTREVARVEPPIQTTPKFRLIGISYYEAKPEESLAFVDEVGKGAHWVRPATKLGHITIEAVREDAVVVNDGTKTYELTPDSAPASPVAAVVPPSMPGAGEALPGAAAAATPPRPTTATATARPTTATAARSPVGRVAPSVDPDRAAQMEAFVQRLKDMQKNLNTDKSGNEEVSDEDRSAQMQALMEQMAASRVSEDEARELDDLGKQLSEGTEDTVDPARSLPASQIPPAPAVPRPPRSTGGRG